MKRTLDFILGGLFTILAIILSVGTYVSFTAPECVMTEDETVFFIHRQTGDSCRLWWGDDGWQLECAGQGEETQNASDLFPVG